MPGSEAAGLDSTITEATVQRVSDALRENERVLWMQKLHAKQAEYDQLLQQHIDLQVQYMDQAKLLVQLQYREQAGLLGQQTRAAWWLSTEALAPPGRPPAASLGLVKVYLAQRSLHIRDCIGSGGRVLQVVRTLERQRQK